MIYPELEHYDELDQLLEDKQHENETIVDVFEVNDGMPTWYRELDELALDELLSGIGERKCEYRVL